MTGFEELAERARGPVIADAFLCDLFKFMGATKAPPQKPPPGSVAERWRHKGCDDAEGVVEFEMSFHPAGVHVSSASRPVAGRTPNPEG